MNFAEKVKISPASIKDLNSLRKLEEVCFPIDRWPLFDLIAVLTFPGLVRLKAEIDDEFIGFITGDIRKKHMEGWITTIGVYPHYQKMGIAQIMLNKCEKEMKVRYIKLSVRKGNLPALNLYYKNGYVHKEIWKNYYVDGEDAIVLEKIVDIN